MGTQAIEVTRFGGPEVLALSSVPEPVAGPGARLGNRG
jgi:NADPH:quinone reductase-like Zn-dependent oxidoreductase